MPITRVIGKLQDRRNLGPKWKIVMYANLEIDNCYVVHGFLLLESTEDGAFQVRMPSKMEEGSKCPRCSHVALHCDYLYCGMCSYQFANKKQLEPKPNGFVRKFLEVFHPTTKEGRLAFKKLMLEEYNRLLQEKIDMFDLAAKLNNPVG